MTAKSNTLRSRLLIGASIGAMLFTGVAEAQDRSGGGRVFSGRGGGDPTAAAARAAQEQATRTNETNSATRRAIDSFRRAAETRQAMNDAQVAARALARATHVTVPNGMGPGGLQVANGVELDPTLWVGANGPVQSQGENGRTNVSIDQTQQQAILSWDSFNVGRETDLTFNQGGADWVALNRVIGNSADPSQILGSIKAPGTILILNQNGVIFGGASQVNVRNLVASSANISNAQFLERGIYSSLSGANYVPSFTNAGGAVRVEAGAQITTNTPSSVTSGGGYVLLMGTEVANEGSIITPRGQTTLSAGDNFIVRRGYGTEENQVSTTRGNEVRGLINAGSTSGTVSNAGLIEAAQGDITLTGRTIRQDGVLVSTTGVNQRGTIHLLNSATDGEGSVTLGADSLTIILPELDSDETALNGQRDKLIEDSSLAGVSGQRIGDFDNLSQLADRLDQSRIEIVTGGDVVFEGGSQTSAQGGQVAVQANTGRITVEDGARIDVSGVMGVALDMESNSIKVNIQGNEMRDSPANRDAEYIRSQDVWIDVRDLILLPDGTGGYEGDRWYTPGGLLEVGGYLANMEHGIGEWAAVGGTITLAASEIVAQQGAVFDISGGSLDYASGYVRSTRVMGADGRMYDIRNAPAHVPIVAIGNAYMRKHDRWGEMYTEVYSDPLFSRGTSMRWENGYTVGRDAGRLILSAPTVIFEGDIVAEVINGDRQTNARADGITDGYKVGQHTVAQGGTLALGSYLPTGGLQGRNDAFETDVRIGDIADVTDGVVDGAIPDDRVNTAWFDAEHLNGLNLGGLDLATRGTITIEAPIELSHGGTVNLIAPVIDLAADITAHSGSIRTSNFLPTSNTQIMPTELMLDGSSSVRVREGVTLDTRGLWVNAQQAPDDLSLLGFIDGGSVILENSGDVIVEAGSLIDVSSGAALLANGETRGGRGGDVSLLADSLAFNDSQLGRLTLDGDIHGYGVAGGGTLRIGSGYGVAIGGDIQGIDGVLKAGENSSVDLIALEEFSVREGEILPADYTYTRTHVMPGETINGYWNLYPNNEIVLAADWTLPPTSGSQRYSIALADGTVYYGRPSGITVVIPAGSVITFLGSPQWFPTNYVIPADVFPNGIPTTPTPVHMRAGSVAPTDVVFSAGTRIKAGLEVSQDVAVAPPVAIENALFRTGFANYVVEGTQGVAVADDAQVKVEMPVLRLGRGAALVETGANTSNALELWTPPVAIEDPQAGSMALRAGADLTLSSYNGPIDIGSDSTVTVDPRRAITLTTGFNRSIKVDGTLRAQNGWISIGTSSSGNPDLRANSESIWIGETATLDVSGYTASAIDQAGHRYGLVFGGGTMTLGGIMDWDVSGEASTADAFIVVRPGAVLDASGASARLDIQNVGVGRPSAIDVATDGGTIVLASNNGIYLDGVMLAHAGGESAAGGTLAIALEAPVYRPSGNEGPEPGVLIPRELVIAQTQGESVLGSDLRPGRADPSLRYGYGRVGVDAIEAGGFGNLNLLSNGVINFDGNVALAMSQSLQLYGRRFGLTDSSTMDAEVSLAAPYVRLAGATRHGTGILGEVMPGLKPSSLPTDTAANIKVDADWIDVRDLVTFDQFESVDLFSRGDLRFLTNVGPTSDDETFPIAPGSYRNQLSAPGNLNITASQVYPATGARARILAGDVMNIMRHDGPTPDAPYSVFGELVLDAPVINQGGIVRAPGGSLSIGELSSSAPLGVVNLLPGSITSASLDGVQIPYGGTVDGLKWLFNGEEIDFRSITGLDNFGGIALGVTLQGSQIDIHEGATIDLRGGGELLGAGFVSGRGGSVDILRHALADANPAFGFSQSGNAVYAIVPGYASGYAPVSPDAGAGNPGVGQQITIPEGVPGLPAGTYTLLPSTYALLPGAFRVELGEPRGSLLGANVPTQNGSWLVDAHVGVANTGIRASLPNQAIITSGETLRQHSRYNETTYSAFAVAAAAQLGNAAPLLPRDGRVLALALNPAQGSDLPLLRVEGDILFDGAAKTDDAAAGNAGYATVNAFTSGVDLEIVAEGGPATEGTVSLTDSALSAIGAPRLVIGGVLTRGASTLVDDSTFPGSVLGILAPGSFHGDVIVRSGARLSAGEVMLVAGDNSSITVEAGAEINTLAQGPSSFDASGGYVFDASRTGHVLAVSNGLLDIIPSNGTGTGGINIGGCLTDDCAGVTRLYSEATIAIVSPRGAAIAPDVRYGTRNLLLGVSSVNIGQEATLEQARAEGALPEGMAFTQSVLDQLIAGNAEVGAPKLENLILSASGSVNFLGTVDISTIDPATGESSLRQLVLNTPAVYGYGDADDVATLTVDRLVWSGMRVGDSADGRVPDASAPPGVVLPGGPGTGGGTLNFNANEIELGYGDGVRVFNQVSLDRLMLGFSTVNFSAAERIGGNAKGTLSVYQSQGADGSFSGGDLSLITPLLTGAAGSTLSLTAGGALDIRAPEGSDLAASNSDALGATLNLKADTISLASAVVLPSGRLTLSADGDVVLTDDARIDMTGREVEMFDVTHHSWGGDVVLASDAGDVTMAGGALIDLSAQENRAGKLSVTALDGAIDLAGIVRGTASGQYDAGGGALLPWQSGGVILRGRTIADFAGLNDRLSEGGIFGERSFQLGEGDLVIGDEVRANIVDIAVDGGSLTVNGTIDASGERVGTIRLAARDGLTLASGSKLDAHGTVLRVDSDGDAIDAPNRAIVELTTRDGLITLASGASIDLRAADEVARGTLTINAPRLTETGGDIAIDAGGSYNISGARSIAVNGFWRYSPTDADGTIVQDNGAATPVGADGSVGLDQIDERSVAFMSAALGNSDLQGRLSGLSVYGDAYHLRPGVEINSADTPNGKLTVAGDLDLSGYRYGPNADRDPGSAFYGAGEPGALVIRASVDLDIRGSINDGFAPPAATPEDDAGWRFYQDILIANVPTTKETVFEAPYNEEFLDYYYLFPSYDGSKPADDPSYPVVAQGGITDGSGSYYGPGSIIPGYLYGQITIEAGTIVTAQDPSTVNISLSGNEPGHKLWAVAPMLAAGSRSWDIRLGSGADLQAASQRALQAANRLAGAGDLTLSDRHFLAGTEREVFSVIRTGTGDLDIFTGGDFRQESLYGIYTAGTQSASMLDGNGNDPFNLPRGLINGKVLGPNHPNYDGAVANSGYQAWYPEHGGNLTLTVGGDLTGRVIGVPGGSAGLGLVASSNVSNWLWTQGGADLSTAWWINFGSYAVGSGANRPLMVAGFTGIGALGGGNVTIGVEGDAGVLSSRGSTAQPASEGLIVAIGSTGRVLGDGTVIKTGGGDLALDVAGVMNTLHTANNASALVDGIRGIPMLSDLNGVIANLRGATNLTAGSLGRIDPIYPGGSLVQVMQSEDPRAFDLFEATAALSSGGMTFVQGDSTTRVTARGDLVIGGFSDPGRAPGRVNSSPYSTEAASFDGGGYASFALFSDQTSLDAMSAGGNLTPFKISTSRATLGTTNTVEVEDRQMSAPPILRFGALSGSAYLDPHYRSPNGQTEYTSGIILTPSAHGQFQLTVAGSVYGAGATIGMSSGDIAAMYGSIEAPLFSSRDIFLNAARDHVSGNLHAGNDDPMRIYAVSGDIIDVTSGNRQEFYDATGQLSYISTVAKPIAFRAGRDIVTVSGIALNNDVDDISTISAGRDVIYANFQIAGPGLLEVSAGRNIYQADQGSLTSVGPLVPGDNRPGAGIAVLAGVGPNGVDYSAIRDRYLDPANLADPERPLADQPGAAVKVYSEELADWLDSRFGFTGTDEEALAYFDGLGREQQSIFLRQVFYWETREGGREYNDPESSRFASYLRGREMIATLFPDEDADGNEITRTGDIIMFGGSGVRTNFGGDIHMMAPGGQIVVGVEGEVPPPSAGIVTQGAGDIFTFSEGSLLLGLSRIMTTFGGSIFGYSEEGDINAGRGAKTTVLYTPPLRTYDNYGNVRLAPQVPSSGAGIATLNPIPEVPGGDIDLVAPLGTIDAGEAGIRVSGSINLAALQVLNAANIQVQGDAAGIPTAVVVNTGALTAASSASTAVAAQAADLAERSRPPVRTEVPTILNVRFLGFGE